MKHLKKRDYSLIDIDLMEREDISFSAKGLMCCIIANSNDDDICSLDDIIRGSADSRREIVSYLNELQDKGLISCDSNYSIHINRKIKNNIAINQSASIHFGIKNLTQASIFQVLLDWYISDSNSLIGYMDFDRNDIVELLPLLNIAQDTVYRALKFLCDKNIISYRKIGGSEQFLIPKNILEYFSKK